MISALQFQLILSTGYININWLPETPYLVFKAYIGTEAIYVSFIMQFSRKFSS